jgi:large subunit ribosomal protein L7/L12
MSDDKKEVVVPEKFQKLVEQIEKLSVLDLSELVSVLEEKFGVSAAAPMMMAAAGAPAAGAAAPAEEKSSFNVELTESGANKIGVIKVLREVTTLGLKEAKDLVDGAPKMVKEGATKEEADTMKKKLEEAGGKVTLK